MRKPKRIKVAEYRKHGFEDLPECLQHKILACLPLKSVFVFKSVSKQWNSSISTEDFLKSYVAADQRRSSPTNRTLLLLRSHINHDPLVLKSPPVGETVRSYSTMDQRLSSSSMHDDEKPFTMLDFPFPTVSRRNIKTGGEPYVVVSASNGLLLCRVCDEVYGICNPITRQWILLPRHSVHYDLCSFTRIAFVAKIDKSSSKLISYRVVFLNVGMPMLNKLRMEIYDSDAKVWTKSMIKLLGSDFVITTAPLQPACLDEIIHWEFTRGEVHYAAAVDPYKYKYGEEDQCRLMVLPTTSIFSSKTTRDTLLGVCNGKLQYLKTHKESRDMAIWVLEDYDREIWVLKHMLTGVNLSYGDQIEHGVCYPLAFHPTDSNVIYIRCTTTEDRPTMSCTILIAFDIEKKTLLPLCSTRVRGYTRVFPFVLPLWPPVFDCPYTTTNLLSA